jgi:hypothetical protein
MVDPGELIHEVVHLLARAPPFSVGRSGRELEAQTSAWLCSLNKLTGPFSYPN